MKPVLNALLIVCLAQLGASGATAQKMPAPSIAVMDVQRIIRDSAAAKSVRPQARKLRSEFQKDVRRQQDELRKAEQKLAQQRTILSPKAFAKKRRDFETHARQAQRDVQARKQVLESAFSAAMEKVRRALIIVAQELAKERKVNIVLPKSVVFLSIKNLDLSKQALERLDKKLPSVKVVLKEKK
jgi:Skp family chaperone for outer membrane proteins